MFEQLKQLASLHDKLFVQLLKTQWDGRWSCSVSLETDGMELKGRFEGDTPEEAVDGAYVKFTKLVKEGAPQLLKVITHQPFAGSAMDDDEIPF